MIRLLRNLLSREWMYGPLMNVRVSKLTGVAERKYKAKLPKSLMYPKGKEIIVWKQVDGLTLRTLPCGRLSVVPPADRFRRAQSAL